MKDLLANLCLMAGGSEIVEAARYFEDIPGYTHQAVMLYHKVTSTASSSLTISKIAAFVRTRGSCVFGVFS